MILLTGASGFIGKHLLSALIKKYGGKNILALTSIPTSECPYLLHHNYNFENDYFEKAGVANSITTIIHAGAFTPKNSNQANNSQMCNSNIFNTHKLITANFPSLQKILYMSTIDVYGKNDIISELSLIEPVSLYAYSKLYVEKMITSWSHSENKVCQILRIGHVYGPGEEAYQKIIPVTLKKLAAKLPIQIWGSGGDLRSFIHINDVVQAILNAIRLPKDIGPVNLVSSQSISISELVNKLISISGKQTISETIATNTAKRNLVFDNAKMKQYLLSAETSLDEGLKDEWNYMKEKQA